MEILMGKQSRFIGAEDLLRRMNGCRSVSVDLGTGDGKFVLHEARREPGSFVVGIDACRENLHAAARGAPGNALFAIANACALPKDLMGLADRVTINFPWGSLRDGLLCAEPHLLAGLRLLARPRAALEVRLNASALAEAGWTLQAGADQAAEVLRSTGVWVRSVRRLDAADLRACPTTWARRMAFGRSPEAVEIIGRFDG